MARKKAALARGGVHLRHALVLIIVVAPIIVPRSARSNVSLKNSNFYTSMTDVSYSGGMEPKIERVYNSKTNFQGMFGWGWGTGYEAYCERFLDGSFVVHESGGGADNTFVQVPAARGPIDNSIATLTAAALKAQTFASDKQDISSYRRKLAAKAYFRRDEEARLRKVPGIEFPPPPPLPVGAKLESETFGHEVVVVTTTGYRREAHSRTEIFDSACRLQRIVDKNGNSLDFEYDSKTQTIDGRPAIHAIRDNFGRKIEFSWKDKHPIGFNTADGRTGSYRFNDKNELIWSKDGASNEYTYEYGIDGRHNMTRIGYSDQTFIEVTYLPWWKNDDVHSVRDRDGSVTLYSIHSTDTTRDIGIDLFSSSRKPLSTWTYHYEFEHDNRGIEFTKRLITTLDGDRTETEYNAFGLPLRIRHGGDETSFRYDAHGHVTRKETVTETTELTYDPSTEKVASVYRYPNLHPEQATHASYQYDVKGNLVRATDDTGSTFALTYDANGRISTLNDGTETLRFEYDTNSQATRITCVGIGSVDVSEFGKGNRDASNDVAFKKIATMWQKFLEIIRPAGVTLSF